MKKILFLLIPAVVALSLVYLATLDSFASDCRSKAFDDLEAETITSLETILVRSFKRKEVLFANQSAEDIKMFVNFLRTHDDKWRSPFVTLPGSTLYIVAKEGNKTHRFYISMWIKSGKLDGLIQLSHCEGIDFRSLTQSELGSLLVTLRDDLQTEEAAVIYFKLQLGEPFEMNKSPPELVKEVFGAIANDMPTIALDDPPQTPWERYPDYGRYSMGWRMGNSETYWDLFWNWYLAQPLEQQQAYQEANPEPEGWEDVYSSFRENSSSGR